MKQVSESKIKEMTQKMGTPKTISNIEGPEKLERKFKFSDGTILISSYDIRTGNNEFFIEQ